jgi:uncharacterized protein YndB with AHSA1/START domain
MTDLPHHLTRRIGVRATPETVFSFLTDTPRWAVWCGAGSTIDPRPGGAMYIRFPNGAEAAGAVVEVQAPELFVFTYGYRSGTPMPAGSSRVTIRLEAYRDGTWLDLLHECADVRVRDEHVQGWRFQLSLFGNAVANEVYADAATAVDEWFRAWRIPDDRAREDAFERIVAPTIAFRDRFSVLHGMPDLTGHTGAAQRVMPGIQMHRHGAIRHCQGTVLADWTAVDRDGAERFAGTNVFTFRADGRIESVTGFLAPPVAV